MADSDEDFDSRRRVRDKFRRERSDYQDRNTGNRRDEWNQRSSRGGGDYPSARDSYSGGGGGGGGGQRKDRYSNSSDRNEMSPPMKRMRGGGGRDWDERSPSSSYTHSSSANYDHYHGNNWTHPQQQQPQQAYLSSSTNQNQNDTQQPVGPTQPPMLTFKMYLSNLDDCVDEKEAVKKYEEYKSDFEKKQINDFFIKHKDEEWFRFKYHPDECDKKKAEHTEALKRRLKVFFELHESGWIDSVSVDVEKSEKITRLLDAAVIKLEGGNNFDLRALDADYEEEKSKEPDLSLFSVEVENEKRQQKLKEEEKRKSLEQESTKIEPTVEDGETKDDENSQASQDKEKKIEVQTEEPGETQGAEDDLEEGETESENPSENGQPDTKFSSFEEDKKVDPGKPRPFHKTASVFLRNLPPNVTRAELEEICKKYPGFLRIAIADPQVERKFYRRGWATYERSTNVREICWQLNAIKIRENCDMGAIVNRDLSRRIRSVNGIASHKNVVRADIRHAAKIVYNFDKQRKLWDDDENNSQPKEDETKPVFGFKSKNPLLKNITDYLIEEASAEEEELLGTSEIGEIDGDEQTGGSGQTLERDESLIKVLDSLLLYLRIVHSLDYYNHTDYPNEDEMPNRIGIMHARGSLPSSKVTSQEINEYLQAFEGKIEPFLQVLPEVTEEELKKMGIKEEEAEIEKFIKDNTQELGKDKWLCPLSGKKFKGPDFVRKHIFNKHPERVEDVKKDVVYFNNYLSDTKRPQLPEHPLNRTPQQGNQQKDQTNNRNDGMNQNMPNMVPWHPGPNGPYPSPPMHAMSFGHPGRPPMPGFGWARGAMPMGPMNMYRENMNRGSYTRRKQVNYRDLDAFQED